MVISILVAIGVINQGRGTMVQHSATYQSGDIIPTARGAELACASDTGSPAPPVRLVVMGTSLTDAYTWPEETARRIEQCTANTVEVERFARSGGTSNWGAQVSGTDKFRGAVSRADVVLIEFLANDADIRRRITVGRSRENHRTIIAAIRHANTGSTGPAIVLMTMNPITGARSIARLRTPDFVQMYRTLAHTENSGMLDLTSRWERTPAGSHRFPDGLHPLQEQADAVIPQAVTGYLTR